MGYVSKDIALITEPEIVTLSAVPNFVVFKSKPGVKKYLEVNIQVNVTPTTGNDIPALTLLQITDSAGSEHVFKGTSDKDEAGGSSFYVSSDTSDTAENLRQALLSDKWFGTNFEIAIPFVQSGNSVKNGRTLNIKSKGAGRDFNISVSAPNNTGNAAYTIAWVNNVSQNNDSISGEESTVEIDLDVYADPDVFLGQDDKPVNPDKIGRYITDLQKTYAGAPLWFELNAMFSRYGGYNRPPDVPGWFDTGTIKAYRFVAKVKGVNSYPFYISNALFVLHGYGPASEAIDLNEYIYDDENRIRLLSNKPRTTYVRGQKEYINFILKDPHHGDSVPEDFLLQVAYQVYSPGNKYLGTVFGQRANRSFFSIVNTCVLDIDAVLDQYPTAGFIRVLLARDEVTVSGSVEYQIRPGCLHTLRQFSFLNRLGGWDAFNFDAGVKEDIKNGVETYNKTLTPSYQKGDSVETVYATTLNRTFTIEGAPVTDEVADWLKELAAARVILDGDGNYVIIEDFTLSKTGAAFNMQRPTIKYRLSEKYVND
ncbi:uncharacterized protein BN783_00204 [Odoribacter sp. CAG:788]|jgi:hypothetical protein|nr:uncharacterized protein BN783_00204 [Odoribacter sp. CAG:788]